MILSFWVLKNVIKKSFDVSDILYIIIIINVTCVYFYFILFDILINSN